MPCGQSGVQSCIMHWLPTHLSEKLDKGTVLTFQHVFKINDREVPVYLLGKIYQCICFCRPLAYAIRTYSYGKKVSAGGMTLPELQTYAQTVTNVSCLKAYIKVDSSPSKQDAGKEVMTISR